MSVTTFPTVCLSVTTFPIALNFGHKVLTKIFSIDRILQKFHQAPIFLFRIRALGTLYILNQPLTAIALIGTSASYVTITMITMLYTVTFTVQFILLMLFDPRYFQHSLFDFFIINDSISTFLFF